MDATVTAALVAASRRWSFRYEVVRGGTVVGTADMETCAVTHDNTSAGVARTAEFALTAATTGINYLSDRIRPYARLLLPDGTWTEWLLGTFNLSAPTRQLEGALKVKGYDNLLVLVEDAITNRLVYATGTGVVTSVASLLVGSGFTSNLIATSTATLPAQKEWPPGTTKLTVINELLGAIDYSPLAVTPAGVPTSEPRLAPTSRPPGWTYKLDPQSVVRPGLLVTKDTTFVPNVIIAVVSEPDRLPLSSTWRNDDPASLFSTVSRGRTIVRVLGNDRSTTDDNLDSVTQAVLDAKVARASVEATSSIEVIEFATGLMPFHDAGGVFVLDYGDGPLTFTESKWTLDVRAGGEMKHTMERAVPL